MKITEVATKVISQWEHGGEYTCHGNGAYGLIGFQGSNVTSLLQRFIMAGGTLKHKPDWYAPELLKRIKNKTHDKRIIPELDLLAKTPLMQSVQKREAEAYMTHAIKHQQQFYGFKTPLAQLILCDMGVNNGIWNKYVIDALKSMSKGSERDIINSAMMIRIKAMKEHGVWDRWRGIRERYSWYLSLWKQDKKMLMKPFQPIISANGRKVNIGSEPITAV